ncbi:AAA-like domain-containing protein [Scytonema hofmannii]|nr:AAA-like domain-containing protein [Scytonema hofmannii]
MTGIYSAHLRRQLAILQKSQELAGAFRQVIAATTSIELDRILAFQKLS